MNFRSTVLADAEHPAGHPPHYGFLRNLMVATDGSVSGERAVTFSIALARRHGSSIALCYAVDRISALGECYSGYGDGDTIFPILQSLDDTAAAILRDALGRVRSAGITATADVLDGDAATAIVRRESDRSFDALVVGTQGKRGFERFFMGSVADSVLRRTIIPVFVVSPSADATDFAFDRILVAVNDSEPSDAAIAFALDFAQEDRSHLIVCSVTEPLDAAGSFERRTAAAATLMELAQARNLSCESVLKEGDPANTLLHVAASRGASCIVVGTHGRRGIHRWIFGSVAESIAERSPIPVAVVRGTR